MNYKTFDINISTTPKPWGAREQQCIQDMINTMVIDTVTGISAPAVGHHHNKLYNTGNNRILEADSQRLGVNCTPNTNWDTGIQSIIEFKGNTDNAAIGMVDNHLHIFDAVIRHTDDKYYRTNASDKPKIFSTSNDGFWTYVGPAGVVGTEYLYNDVTSCVNAFLDNGTYFNTRRGNFRFRVSTIENVNTIVTDGTTGNVGIGGLPTYRLDVHEPGFPGGGAFAPVIRILCTDPVYELTPAGNAAYFLSEAGNGAVSLEMYSRYDDYSGACGNINVTGASNPDFHLLTNGNIRFKISNAGVTRIGTGNPATNYIQFASNGDQTFAGSAGLYPRTLNQSSEPAAGGGATQLDTSEMCIWTDSDDAKCYLCYNHGGTVKTVELT